MKKLFITGLASISLWNLSAQVNPNLSGSEYQQKKLEYTRELREKASKSTEKTKQPGTQGQNISPLKISNVQNSSCNCIIPLDNSFSPVQFFLGNAIPDNRTDDGSSSILNLPFDFYFYGDTIHSLYINNNGNVSFGQSYSAFSSNGFPDTVNMVAPFWADVDTRDTNSGLVYYKITPHYIIVKWDRVGYYNQMADKLNDFQLILSDGQDSILPPGINVSFCYGDMQWTTGSASSGNSGFGGIPATVGANRKTGGHFFQIGRFGLDSNLYDGPINDTDGVHFLDNQAIYFNAAGNNLNIAPIAVQTSNCDTLYFPVDSAGRLYSSNLQFQSYFLSPENNQDISLSISSDIPAANISSTILNHSNNGKGYNISIDRAGLNPGLYTITTSGTDNGSPSLSTTHTFYLRVDSLQSIGISPLTCAPRAFGVYPNPMENFLEIYNNTKIEDIQIYSVLGAIVYQANPNDFYQMINTQSLASGLYIINLKTENNPVKTIKLIKK